MRGRRYTRVHRLLKIITLIQSGPRYGSGLNAGDLSRECGTSVRNIYRDLKMLDGAGVPVYRDDEYGGYRIRGDFFMPPVELTLEESLSLMLAARTIGKQEQVGMMKPLAMASAKVSDRLPMSIRRELDKCDGHIDIRLARSMHDDGIKDVYRDMQLAIGSGRKLDCRYVSPPGRREKRGSKVRGCDGDFLFRPYCLYWGKRAWYAIGLHEYYGEVRCMKLSRFEKVLVTKERYTIPKAFSLEKFLGKCWRMIPEGKVYKVELWFDPEFAETVADTHWHDTQDVVWQDDGSVTMRFEVDGLGEIKWWVLGMGPHCVVRKPVRLRGEVRKLAEGIIKNY